MTVLSDRIESHLIFAIFLHFSFIEGCKSAFLFQSARAVFSLTVSECILTDTVIRTGGRVVLGLLGAGSQLWIYHKHDVIGVTPSPKGRCPKPLFSEINIGRSEISTLIKISINISCLVVLRWLKPTFLWERRAIHWRACVRVCVYTTQALMENGRVSWSMCHWPLHFLRRVKIPLDIREEAWKVTALARGLRSTNWGISWIEELSKN